jgi:hypothetical protein
MKNGVFIDKLRYIDLLDAITHVEIGNTNECVPYNISYDYSISFHYTFCFLFRLCHVCSFPCFNKHPKVNLFPILLITIKYVQNKQKTPRFVFIHLIYLFFFHFGGYLVRIIIVTSLIPARSWYVFRTRGTWIVNFRIPNDFIY